jgi:hypothetical protein
MARSGARACRPQGAGCRDPVLDDPHPPRPRPRHAASPITSPSRATPRRSRLDAGPPCHLRNMPGPHGPHPPVPESPAPRPSPNGLHDDRRHDRDRCRRIAALWDALACPEARMAAARPIRSPPTAFWRRWRIVGLGRHRHRLAPHALIARQGGQMIGALPLYVKSHSQGEYIFDHGWAQAWMNGRAGAITPSCRSPCPSPPPPAAAFLTRPA